MNPAGLDVLLGVTQALALAMSISFVSYVCVIVLPYLRHHRAVTGDPGRFAWHFLVPCRDEQAVIGETLTYLRSTFFHAHVWVIDDGSADATADTVRELGRGDRRVHLVRRRRPHARSGKGDALNAAYLALRTWIGDSTPADQVIVVVVDADGRPASNCLEVCAAPHLFGSKDVGAVQIDVRMTNRDEPEPGGGRLRRWFGLTMVRMQDLEFRTAIAAIQLSRGYTGTIAMGGNGQFTRLSALQSIAGPDGRPWRGSLLEDFELGVHLLTEGWKTGFSRDTHVDQEGLYSLRRFLVQRTRWGQGTMQCARYLRRIWDSEHLSTLGATEMFYYLMQPWMQLLGTVIYPIPFVLVLAKAMGDPVTVWSWFTGGAWLLFCVYGVFGLLPFLIWGPIYQHKCRHGGANPVSIARGVGYGLAYALYIYTFYVTSWRAFLRLVRGANGWSKTRRNTEELTGAVALDH